MENVSPRMADMAAEIKDLIERTENQLSEVRKFDEVVLVEVRDKLREIGAHILMEELKSIAREMPKLTSKVRRLKRAVKNGDAVEAALSALAIGEETRGRKRAQELFKSYLEAQRKAKAAQLRAGRQNSNKPRGRTIPDDMKREAVALFDAMVKSGRKKGCAETEVRKQFGIAPRTLRDARNGK